MARLRSGRQRRGALKRVGGRVRGRTRPGSRRGVGGGGPLAAFAEKEFVPVPRARVGGSLVGKFKKEARKGLLTASRGPTSAAAFSAPRNLGAQGGALAKEFKLLKAAARSRLGSAPKHHVPHLNRILGHRGHRMAATDFAPEKKGGSFWTVLKGLFDNAPAIMSNIKRAFEVAQKAHETFQAGKAVFGEVKGVIDESRSLRKRVKGEGIIERMNEASKEEAQAETARLEKQAEEAQQGEGEGGALIPSAVRSHVRRVAALAPKGVLAAQFKALRRHVKTQIAVHPQKVHKHLKRITRHGGHLKAMADFHSEPVGGGFWSSLVSMMNSTPGNLQTLKNAFSTANRGHQSFKAGLGALGRAGKAVGQAVSAVRGTKPDSHFAFGEGGSFASAGSQFQALHGPPLPVSRGPSRARGRPRGRRGRR